MKLVKPRLEVHEHAYPAGGRPRIHHAHSDGNSGHEHPETGPACFTIDKDAWLHATGMVGGGRKQYRAHPWGPQLPRVELEDWQRTFLVVLGPLTEVDSRREPTEFDGGGSAVARMALTFDMEPIYEVTT